MNPFPLMPTKPPMASPDDDNKRALEAAEWIGQELSAREMLIWILAREVCKCQVASGGVQLTPEQVIERGKQELCLDGK